MSNFPPQLQQADTFMWIAILAAVLSSNSHAAEIESKAIDTGHLFHGSLSLLNASNNVPRLDIGLVYEKTLFAGALGVGFEAELITADSNLGMNLGPRITHWWGSAPVSGYAGVALLQYNGQNLNGTAIAGNGGALFWFSERVAFTVDGSLEVLARRGDWDNLFFPYSVKPGVLIASRRGSK